MLNHDHKPDSTHYLHSLDSDPVRRSWREAPAFNNSWLKNGERLTWVQRIGFALLSLSMLGFGLTMFCLPLYAFRDGGLSSDFLLDLCLSLSLGLFTLIPGVIGLRNVLRFTKQKSE